MVIKFYFYQKKFLHKLTLFSSIVLKIIENKFPNPKISKFIVNKFIMCLTI